MRPSASVVRRELETILERLDESAKLKASPSPTTLLMPCPADPVAGRGEAIQLAKQVATLIPADSRRLVPLLAHAMIVEGRRSFLRGRLVHLANLREQGERYADAIALCRAEFEYLMETATHGWASASDESKAHHAEVHQAQSAAVLETMHAQAEANANVATVARQLEEVEAEATGRHERLLAELDRLLPVFRHVPHLRDLHEGVRRQRRRSGES